MAKFKKISSPLDKLFALSNDKSNYQNRLEAVEELGKYKFKETIERLWQLMLNDRVYSVQTKAFFALKRLGENVNPPSKRKGYLIKDINRKLITIHKTFNNSDYSMYHFKKKFKERYPEAYDVYKYEKKNYFDTWIITSLQNLPKKKLKNIYNINIKFNIPSSSKKKLITKDEIPYFGFIDELDEIEINTHEIIIKAERSAIYHPKHILDNDTNTIHIQIIKSLIVYYLCIQKFIEIKSIYITREKTKLLEDYSIPNIDISLEQVLSNTYIFNNDCVISPDNVKDIFKIDEKSSTLFNASSYLLKALSTEEPTSKFEKLWKSFTSIYRYIGQSKSDFECHKKLKEFLLNNNNHFINCNLKANSLTNDILREKIRFRDLILNDYKEKELTVSFLAFIYEHKDYRISQTLLDTLVYREGFIKDIMTIEKVESIFNNFDDIKFLYQNANSKEPEYIYNKTVEYLNINIQNNIVSNMEVIALICIKYGYYVRNKILHAEKNDLSFRFIKNNQIDEIYWLNEILELLIIELIKINDKWIP